MASLEMALYAGQFLNMVIRFRFLHGDIMGLVGYFTALSEVPSAFSSYFNRALVRYLPVCEMEMRSRIFSVALIFQMGVLAIFLGLIALGESGVPGVGFWKGHYLVDGHDMAWMRLFLIFSIIIGIMHRFITAFHSGVGRILLVQWVEVGGALMNAASALSIAFLLEDRFQAVAWILFAQISVTALTTLYLWFGIRSDDGIRLRACIGHFRRWRQDCLPTFRKYFAKYAVPLQASSIFAYLKENIGVLLLAQFNFLESAGVYHLANRMYAVPRKFMPGLIGKMLPKMVKEAEKDRATFFIRYNLFAWTQLTVSIISGTVIFLSVPLFKSYFHFENAGVGIVFYLFSTNLVIQAIAQMNINIIMMKDNMTRFMYSSLVRSIVVVGLTWLLIRDYYAMGASLALTISSVVVAAILAWETRGTDLFNWRLNWQHAFLALFTSLVWLIPFFLLKGAYL